MRGSAGTRWLGLFLCVLAAMMLFAAPASARKTHLFLETFGSANQPEFGEPGNSSLGAAALAVDQSSGDLLVVDNGPDTLSRWKPNGEPDPFPALGTNVIDAKKGPGGKACGEEPASCDLNPEHPGFFFRAATEEQIAVDNSGTLTDGDIYVTSLVFKNGESDFATFVDIFASDGHYLGQLTAAGASAFKFVCGVAVDPGGNVFLSGGLVGGEPSIYKFDPSANPPLNTDSTATFIPPEPVCSLAAGAGPSAGALFGVQGTTFEENSLLKFNAANGAFQGIFDSGEDQILSVDPVSGDLYTYYGIPHGHNFVEVLGLKELSPSGALVSTTNASISRGIAIDGAAEKIYESEGQHVSVLGPLVTLPDVLTGATTITGDTSVRIEGTIDPDGEALEDCHFEYVDDAHYEKFANNPYVKGASVPCEAPNAAEVGSGSSPVEVHVDLSGLQGETAYHYRLVAFNHNVALYPNDKSTVVEGKDQLFKTPSKPGIKELWSQDVVTTDATLKAKLNPENSSTKYRFEWGPDTSYGQSSAEFELGPDGADHTVGFKLSGLEPASTYHYRLVAENGIGKSESADRHFTTFPLPSPSGAECVNAASRIGPAAFLPDCRAYEMVSPVDKAGGDIRVGQTTRNVPAVLEQAADSGERLAYGSVRSFGGAASAPFTSQYIAQRIEGAEWQTHPINPPRGTSTLIGLAQQNTEFKAFSPDLCQTWLTSFAEPPLAPGGVAEYVNLYRRTDQLCSESGKAGYEALAPLVAPEGVPPPEFRMELLGVSDDDEQAIFVTQPRGKLLPEGTAVGEQLYEYASGAGLRFLCVLPDRSPTTQTCTAGPSAYAAEPIAEIGRISADGTRIFWSTEKIYVRENADQPESARQHGAATGKGNLIGPASGTGNLVAGSELLKSVKPSSGEFAVGQEISAASGGIPAKTTIVKIEETAPGTFTLTLSAKVSAGKTKIGDALTGAASATVPGLLTESGTFEAGQEISAPAIPPGTTVLSCSPSCGPAATSLTLSAKATKTEAAAKLSATSPCTEAATKACTVPVSEAAEEEAGTHGSDFWGAATDGSEAIFSTGNTSGNANLYSFTLDGEVTTPIAEGVYGVMGISEDAKRVYFASREALDAGATEGKPNLYLYEAGVGGGATSFIATLALPDQGEGVSFEPYFRHTARVSPDGAHATFVSVAPLTGYDNTEARDSCAGGAGGDLCPEIYRYDATADQLLCVSCNPSGARPEGESQLPSWESPFHAARVLADDERRLYFESADGLTPRDTDGTFDVYQWEEPGAGSCEESSPDYSAQDGGCIDLISSGQSPADSRFVEADPSGQNVFIATGSSLLPQDPGGFDIYDARVNGGLPIPGGIPPSCEGEACQGVVEAPNDPTPASESFEGAGNVREEAPLGRKPCAKGKVRRHGKCVARKHAAKKHHKRAKRSRRAGR
jgi:hypothetical protein